MGFLSRFRKHIDARSSEVQDATVENKISEYITDSVNRSSIVTQEGALGLSAVWSCCRLISETVATMPIHLYERVARGRNIKYDHSACSVLNRPNDFLYRYDVLYHLIIGCVLWGNGYVRIHRDRYFKAISLELLQPTEVEPYLSVNKILFYRVQGGEILNSCDIIHIKGLTLDGIIGKSPISVHRENLSLSKSAQEYGEKFFSQGGNTSGIFKYPHKLSDVEYKRLKTGLREQVVGIAKAHSPMLLEGGMDYQRITIPPEDAQFIATRKFQKNEIATIYGVPPHMIADLERATNNNIEHQGIEFVIYCLMPYLVKIEAEFDRKLLTEKESSKYYFKFNVNGLLRGDAKSRSEFYKTMSLMSAMTPNEIREREDMNSYEDGDKFYYQLNMQSVGDDSEKNKKE